MAHSDNVDGISAPPTVVEGGTLTIEVSSNVTSVEVTIPEHGTSVSVPVVDGRAEYSLPPGVQAGSEILVSDLAFPDPSTASVEVVGPQTR